MDLTIERVKMGLYDDCINKLEDLTSEIVTMIKELQEDNKIFGTAGFMFEGSDLVITGVREVNTMRE